MKVEEKTLARVYSFDLKFKGGKRTQFYRKLLGFESKTVREDKEGREKVYKNFYPGLLTPLPHLRLGKSVIAVPKILEDRVDDFFQDPKWGGIDLYTFDGILPQENRMMAMEEALNRIKVTPDESLADEIKSLKSLQDRGDLDSEEIYRIRRALEKCEELMSFDWTDGSKFSEKLEGRLEPLRECIG